MKFKPIGERVLVKQEKRDITEGGIHLPETVNRPNVGIIVALGFLSNRITLDIGDRILFKDLYHNPIEIDGEQYLIVDNENILGIF